MYLEDQQGKQVIKDFMLDKTGERIQEAKDCGLDSWMVSTHCFYHPADYLWENRMLEAKQNNIVVLNYKGDWVSGVVLLGSLCTSHWILIIVH